MNANIRVEIISHIPLLQVIDMVNKQTYDYPFTEVEQKELMQLRLSQQPGVVYKKHNRLFYVSIPENLRLSSQELNLGNHLCGKDCSRVCNGCPRTSDLTVHYQMRKGKPFTYAVEDSWRIEKYNFISEAVETFNMEAGYDALIVLNCANHTARKPKHLPVTNRQTV